MRDSPSMHSEFKAARQHRRDINDVSAQPVVGLPFVRGGTFGGSVMLAFVSVMCSVLGDSVQLGAPECGSLIVDDEAFPMVCESAPAVQLDLAPSVVHDDCMGLAGRLPSKFIPWC